MDLSVGGLFDFLQSAVWVSFLYISEIWGESRLPCLCYRIRVINHMPFYGLEEIFGKLELESFQEVSLHHWKRFHLQFFTWVVEMSNQVNLMITHIPRTFHFDCFALLNKLDHHQKFHLIFSYISQTNYIRYSRSVYRSCLKIQIPRFPECPCKGSSSWR